MADKPPPAEPSPYRALIPPIFFSEKPSPPRTLADLLTAFAPPIVRDRWFKDTTVYLDGYVFERCRFDRCQLVTQQATFVFRECVISADCSVYFSGPGLKLARFLMHTLAVKQRIQIVPGEQNLFPQINADGTFTLE